MKNQGRHPIHHEAAGGLHREGRRPGPAIPAREAVFPLSVGWVAALTVETVEQEAPDVTSVSIARCANSSASGQAWGSSQPDSIMHADSSPTLTDVSENEGPPIWREEKQKATLGPRYLRRSSRQRADYHRSTHSSAHIVVLCRIIS